MSGAGAYLLLVEDDSDVGSLLRHHLESLGWRVVHAHTGEAALAQLDADPPDVAVVDILLPGVDGREVIRRLRGSTRHEHCRIVVASILDEGDQHVEADAVLAKPFRRRDVVDALTRAGVPFGGDQA